MAAKGEAEGSSVEVKEATFVLTPVEVERNELGYQIEDVRGKSLRVIRSQPSQDNGEADAMFFVHGGGGRGGQFKHQIKAFKEDYLVVAFDFLGHGDSPQPNSPEMYTEDEHFGDLLALYERYKRKANVIVAHCYGCIHTIRLLHHLDQEGRLTEIAGVVFLALGYNCPAGSIATKILGKLPAVALEWLRPMARASSNAALFSRNCDPALIEFENAMSDNNRMYMMKAILADCSSQRKWDGWLYTGQEVLVPSHTVRRMLICGDSDGIFPVDYCDVVRRQLDIPPPNFHIIKEAGHLSMLEKPDEVTRLVEEFVTHQVRLRRAGKDYD